jgi:hypothetical protein
MSGTRATPIYGGIWGDDDFENYDPLKMLLFLFYLTNPMRSVSGVYQCTPKKAQDFTGIPRPLIRHYLGAKPLTAGELRAQLEPLLIAMLERADDSVGFKNVLFDPKHQIVFVKNLVQKSLGGRRDLVAQGFIGDHRKTYKAAELWKEWQRLYREKVDEDPELTRYFEAVNSSKEPRAFTKEELDRATRPPEETLTDRAEEAVDRSAPKEKRWRGYGSAIKDELHRYVVENDQGDGIVWRLDQDDREGVLRVLEHLTKHATTKKPLVPKRRWEIRSKAGKVPTMQVARAAYVFEDEGCLKEGKRADYFFGILRNSALSWFVEWRAAKVKEREKGGFDDGRSAEERPGGDE